MRCRPLIRPDSPSADTHDHLTSSLAAGLAAVRRWPSLSLPLPLACRVLCSALLCSTLLLAARVRWPGTPPWHPFLSAFGPLSQARQRPWGVGVPDWHRALVHRESGFQSGGVSIESAGGLLGFNKCIRHGCVVLVGRQRGRDSHRAQGRLGPVQGVPCAVPWKRGRTSTHPKVAVDKTAPWCVPSCCAIMSGLSGRLTFLFLLQRSVTGDDDVGSRIAARPGHRSRRRRRSTAPECARGRAAGQQVHSCSAPHPCPRTSVKHTRRPVVMALAMSPCRGRWPSPITWAV